MDIFAKIHAASPAGLRNPANPRTDCEPERLGVYASETEAEKALSKCTPYLEWCSGYAMPFVRATWHEIISYQSDCAEDADECIDTGDTVFVDCNDLPKHIDIDSYTCIRWDGYRWAAEADDD